MTPGAVGPRAGGVDEQRLEVGGLGRVRERDRGVEEPGEDVPLVEHRLGAVVEVVGELGPDLGADLLARAAHGDLAGPAAGRLPVRDVDREDALDAPVAVAREVDLLPELGLRDRGQRPLGVDVDRVAVLERHVAVEVEEDAVHPARDEPVELRERRVEGAQRRARELAHDLDRERGHVVVGGDGARGRGDAGDAAVRERQALDRGIEPQLDAEGLEVGDPRVDPRVVGRGVEHAVGAAAGAREVEDDLGEDQPAGAGADLPPAGRHERAGEPLPHPLLERLRAPLGADEVPPADLLPLLVAALVTAREQGHHPLDQHGVLLRRDPEPGHELEQEAAHEREVLERLRQVRRGHQLVLPARLREQDAGGVGEVVEHGPAAVRYPPHRVRHVLIEAGEEAEAVLGRQVLAVAGAGVRDRQAARLAAGDVARLEHDDLEAALGQLVRGGEAGDAASEDRHPAHGDDSLTTRPICHTGRRSCEGWQEELNDKR